MISSKLFKLYRSLTKEEFKEFGKFVASPYFNTNPTLIKFNNLIKCYFPKLKNPKFKKEKVFEFLFSEEKKYNDKRMWNLMLDMSNLIETFFMQKEVSANSMLQKRLLFEGFTKRNLSNESEKHFEKQLQSFENIPNKNRNQYLELFLISEKYYHNPDVNRIDLNPNYLSDALIFLNHFYILSKLELAIEIMSRNLLLDEPVAPFYFLKHFDNYIKHFVKKDKIIFEIFQSTLEFYNLPSDKILKKSIKLLNKNLDKISKFDKKLLFKIFVNQMSYLLRLGSTIYFQKIFDFYKFGLEKEILTYDNKLTAVNYVNIISLAAANKNMSLAVEYLEKYKFYVPPLLQEEAYALAKSTILYDQKKYGEVLTLLQPYTFRNSKFGLRFRFILMKTYTELLLKDISYQKIQKSHIKKFEKYLLTTSSISKVKKESTINFLKVVSFISKAIISNNIETDLEFLIEAKKILEESNSIVAKNWLLQKINHLKQPN